MEIRQNVDPNDVTARYLGDGIHARFDGHYIWLRSQDGDYANHIPLDPEVFAALCKYAKDIYRMEE